MQPLYIPGESFDSFPSFELHPENVGEVLKKAYVPGQGIVQAGETTAAALRAQVLDPLLVAALYQTQDARLLQLMYALGALRADSVAYEYTNMEFYGDDREAFIQDIGPAVASYTVIADQVNTADDVYRRYVKNARFLTTRRIISLSAALSRAVTNPVAAAMVGATNEIIGKANAAMYWGNPATNSLHWEGLEFQIMNSYFNYMMTEPSVSISTLATASPGRANIVNAGGKLLAEDAELISNQQIAEPLIQEAAARIREKFGFAQFVLVNPRLMQEIAASLLAKERFVPSMQTGLAGIFANVLASSEGTPLQIVVDPLMQPGRSLVPYKPLVSAADANTLPTRSVGGSAITATASFLDAAASSGITKISLSYLTGSWNNMTGDAPDDWVPVAPEGINDEDWYFSYSVGASSKVQIVYKLYLINGNGEVVTTATIYATDDVPGTNKMASVLISGTVTGPSGSQYSGTGTADSMYYKNCRIKIFRSRLVHHTAAGNVGHNDNHLKYVGDAGIYYYNNAYRFFFLDVPGSTSPQEDVIVTNASSPTTDAFHKPTMDFFVITADKPPFWNTRFLQFLPLMQRALPPAPLAEQFAYLLFGTPIVRVPAWLAIVKNVAWSYVR